jgi:NTE family protein
MEETNSIDLNENSLQSHSGDEGNGVTETTIDDLSTVDSNHIKHIVLTGGGVVGLTAYGIFRETQKRGLWNIENIQSIYGTSIGALMAFVIALKYDWESLDDYLIKRPWHNVFQYDLYSLFGAIEKRGIFDSTILDEFFKPLLKGMDLSMDITMKEFYEWSKIDIHVFTTNINSFECLDISHKTHPDWRVVDAVYASACLPIFFSPFSKNGTYYVDGGIFLNYPLAPCIKQNNPDEILGIRLQWMKLDNIGIQKKTTLLDYLLILLHKILHYLNHIILPVELKNQYMIQTTHLTLSDMYEMTHNQKRREEWIQKGESIVKGNQGFPLNPIL